MGTPLLMGAGKFGEAVLPGSQLGTIISQDYSGIANLNDYTVVNPASTWAIVSGKIHTEMAAIGGFANYIYYNPYGTSILDRWKQTVNLIVTKDATTIGFTIGCKSTNAISSDVYQAFCAMYVGGEGQLTIFRNGATTGEVNLIGMAISNGDSLTLVFERTFGALPQYVFTVTNNTTATTRSVTHDLITGLTTTNLTNTAMKWALYNNGGKYDVSLQTIESTALKNVNRCFIGYSIPELFNAGGYANSWPAQAMIGNAKSYTKLCSQSGHSQTFLDAMPEIISINSKIYILSGILGNDKQLGVADATADANYASIVSQIKAGVPGCRVIHILESPRNAFSMVPVNARITTLAGSDTVFDMYALTVGVGTNINAAYDTDGTHINATGQAVMGAGIKPIIA